MKVSLVMAAGMVLLSGASCSREPDSNIQDLAGWKDKTIHAMIAEFGKPAEEHVYTIGQAPTKGWNHGIIFSVYPKNKPENRDVVIKEYAWDRNHFEIRVCCHLVDGDWLVMGASKIQKEVRF
ncbi:MAG TPA: hypothetical protein VMX36_00915 [Sedimentisphaerales bacterium]|nr:hypothetical protein [Sedimentisphaerales bacterium]